MIFVMVGTSQYPFDRLLKTLDDNVRTGDINQQVFAQIGSSRYRPLFFDYREFLPLDEMAAFIQKADIVVTHAGVGSTLLCLSFGKIPILFPRKQQHGLVEHVDNHQLEFARQMDRQQKLLVAYDEQDLINKIKNYKRLINILAGQNLPSGKGNLVNFLKTKINEK